MHASTEEVATGHGLAGVFSDHLPDLTQLVVDVGNTAQALENGCVRQQW